MGKRAASIESIRGSASGGGGEETCGGPEESLGEEEDQVEDPLPAHQQETPGGGATEVMKPSKQRPQRHLYSPAASMGRSGRLAGWGDIRGGRAYSMRSQSWQLQWIGRPPSWQQVTPERPEAVHRAAAREQLSTDKLERI